MAVHLLITVWILVIPLSVTAHEPKRHVVVNTYKTDFSPGDQAVATATCPQAMSISTGGYKWLKSTLSMRALVMIENRPVPEAREWLVTLLYDPAPGDIQHGSITLEVSAVCRPAPILAAAGGPARPVSGVFAGSRVFTWTWES